MGMVDVTLYDFVTPYTFCNGKPVSYRVANS